MSRYLISGYYGFGNAGDEAILLAIISDLRRSDPDAEITVLSSNPGWTSAEHRVQSISRTNLPQVVAAMRKTDLFFSGGGGLLQDVTSKRSLLYYLALIKLANWFGKPAMVFANSLGPISGTLNRRLTAAVLNRVPYITVRDSNSRQFLAEIGVDRPYIEETADPVLLLSGPSTPKVDRLITFAIRAWPSEHDYINEIVEAANLLTAGGFQTQFAPFHFTRDLELAQALSAKVAGSSCLSDQLTVPELLQVIASSDVVVGMRLHALVMAAICQRPMVGIGYDPKVTGFLAGLEQPLAGTTGDLEAVKLADCVRDVWQRQSSIAWDLRARLPQLRERASRNTQIAVGLARGQRP